MTKEERAVKILINVQSQFQASLDEVDVDKDCKEAEEDNTEIVNALEIAIKAIKALPRKNEVILTNKEYRELVSNEYENGYTKGYSEALEQELILDKIRSEIIDTGAYEQEVNGKTEFLKGIDYCLGVIDKYNEKNKDKNEIDQEWEDLE